MFETRQIVFEISARLYERMEERAAERRERVDAWTVRAVIRALHQPECAVDRVALETAWDARPRLPATRPAAQPITERKPHAAHS
jgi:hypothetical protein